jgi:hypothetical protein
VPYFTRDYRTQMVALRQQRNAYTALDANREALSARLGTNPELNNAQFVIFNYQSFDELSRAVEIFLRAEGSPGAVSDPVQRQLAAYLAGTFRSVADRAWLRTFMQALTDERTRFYSAYWNSERNARNAALNAVETLWADSYRQRFSRFLVNSRIGDGTLLLSMPINGEGRAVFSGDGNAVAVPFPPTAQRAREAIFTFAHEVVARAVDLALRDNLTPVQVREGAADRYAPLAAVRGGALLLQRISPADVADYMRYYLGSAGQTVPPGDPTAAFAAAFSLPDAVVDGIRRQIDVILGGI